MRNESRSVQIACKFIGDLKCQNLSLKRRINVKDPNHSEVYTVLNCGFGGFRVEITEEADFAYEHMHAQSIALSCVLQRKGHSLVTARAQIFPSQDQ